MPFISPTGAVPSRLRAPKGPWCWSCGHRLAELERRRCRPCLDEARIKQHAAYTAHRAKGLCGAGFCKQPAAPGHSMCDDHRVRNSQTITEHFKARVQSGMCRRCGKHPVWWTKNWCFYCYQAGEGHQGRDPLPRACRKAVRRYLRLTAIDDRRAQAEAACDYLHEPRLRLVVQLRHGLLDGIDHTLVEIGKALGVTRERARQLEATALRRLRKRNLPTDLMSARGARQHSPGVSNPVSEELIPTGLAGRRP